MQYSEVAEELSSSVLKLSTIILELLLLLAIGPY